jgi:uncharacterized protein (UPF0335 family)
MYDVELRNYESRLFALLRRRARLQGEIDNLLAEMQSEGFRTKPYRQMAR